VLNARIIFTNAIRAVTRVASRDINIKYNLIIYTSRLSISWGCKGGNFPELENFLEPTFFE